MTPGNTRDSRRRRLAAILGWTALFIVLLGAITVYVTQRRSDNAPQITERQTSGKTTPTVFRAPAHLKGLNRGDMAGVLLWPKPKPLPDFTFVTESGEELSLKAWRGKVVLLNIWATWCPPCRKEMPALDRLQAELGGKDFDLVTISIDRGGLAKPKAFFQSIGVTHLKLYGEGKPRLTPTLKIVGMPTTLLIDRQGREVGRLVGPAEWDTEDAKRLIRAIIAHEGKG